MGLASDLQLSQPCMLSGSPLNGEALRVGWSAAMPDDRQHAAGLPLAAWLPAVTTATNGPTPKQQLPPAMLERPAKTESSPAQAAGEHLQPRAGQTLQLWPASDPMLANHGQACWPEQHSQAAGGHSPRVGQPQHAQQQRLPQLKLPQKSTQPAVGGDQPMPAAQHPSVKCEAASTGVSDGQAILGPEMQPGQRKGSHGQAALSTLPPLLGAVGPGLTPGAVSPADGLAHHSPGGQAAVNVLASGLLPPVSLGLGTTPPMPPHAVVVDLTQASGSDGSPSLKGAQR